MAEIAGLKLIVPSSVAGSGVSVSASGKVTFTAASTININGCFTSSYDNYLIVIRFKATASAPNLQCRLRASGTDATATNYTRQYLDALSTSVAGARSTDSAFTFGFTGTSESGSHIYLYGPALAQPTAARGVNVSSYDGASISDNANTHSLSTAYDGCTFLSSTSDFTGALCVYGLAQ
jgi:hypothetical protein